MLEAASTHILREVVAEAEEPMFLYSVDKASAVMLTFQNVSHLEKAT